MMEKHFAYDSFRRIKNICDKEKDENKEEYDSSNVRKYTIQKI